MTAKITLLGTGTCQLQTHRAGSSVLVELEDLLFVYDTGRGISLRLVEKGIRQDDLQHIVLSHFHPDHISDLIPLLHASCWSRTDPRTKDLHIYGPIGLEVQLMRLLSLFGPDELKRDTFQIHLHEVREEEFVIGKHRFAFVSLPPFNNKGLKFEVAGKRYAFTGDSNIHEQEIAFLSDVEMAIIDAGHPTDKEVVELASKTQVPKLVLSHLYRETDEKEIRQQASQSGYTGELIVGKDFMSFDIA